MTKAFVIHVSEMPRFPGAVYIGRRNNRRRLPESPFANPFRVTEASDLGPGITRHMACLMYRDYLRSSEHGRMVLARLPELRNRPLACWCRRSDASQRAWKECHGDVIASFLKTYTDDELRALAAGQDGESRTAGDQRFPE